MCIIVIKEKGVKMPDRKTLKVCFANNSDGAGFMYNERGKVVIRKGFMTWKDFDNALSDVEKKMKNVVKHSFIFHFRITTQGGTNPMNTHPFPISGLDYELQQTYIKTDIGVVHNGIISLTSDSGYYDWKEKKYMSKYCKLSDTQIFIRDYMTDIYELNPQFYLTNAGLNLISTLIESKMAFLDKDGLISTVGSFNTDDNGVHYSNLTWKTTKYNYLIDEDLDYYEHMTDAEILADFANSKKYLEDKTEIIVKDGITLKDSDFVNIMPIDVEAYWNNTEEGFGEIDSNEFGLDEYGFLYTIDNETEECMRYTAYYVTVFDMYGIEIQFDYATAKSFKNLEADYAL